MPHVITQSCCSDASCVYACPVNCIQPTPDDPLFLVAEMLHVDPSTCVDCGACTSACPVDAIKPHTRLTEAEQPFLEINRSYFKNSRHKQRPKDRPLLAPVVPPLRVRDRKRPLRVAIVGSGPAAMYAADEVLTIPGASVDIYERLANPYGLARLGVAPDHRLTRRVTRQLDVIAAQPNLAVHTRVEVGVDRTHAQLLANHDAVIYAVGAACDKRLQIPGAQLPRTASATEFVGWYNGHPDHAHHRFDLAVERVVLIGNGNVALDVARILSVAPASLAQTDIAPDALTALRASRVKEVVIVGRRGPEHSAFTLPELIGLSTTAGVQLRADAEELTSAAVDQSAGPQGDRTSDAAEARAGGEYRHKLELLTRLAAERLDPSRRQVRLRYELQPQRIVGRHMSQNEARRQASGVEFSHRLTGVSETIDAGLILTSIGYRGTALPDLPFDEQSGTIPNSRGRVIDPQTGSPWPATYVAGWIKRGPSGFIGTNRSCAQESVRMLVDDWNAGLLGISSNEDASDADRHREPSRL